MSEITFCLLNYRRPANIGHVVESIRRQTVNADIFLWNNGEPLPREVTSRVNWLVDSTQNMKIVPRWWMASQATTRLVCSLDDDLALRTPLALARLIEGRDAYCEENAAFGPWAVRFTGQVYAGARHFNGNAQNYFRVDMVKGRCLCIATKAVQQFQPAALFNGEDDIALCGLASQGRPLQHVCGPLGQFFGELPAPAAWSRRPDHHERRELARQHYFPNSYKPAWREAGMNVRATRLDAVTASG